MASTTPNQSPVAVAVVTEEPPPPPKRPRWLVALRWLAYHWWQFVGIVILGNFVPGAVLQGLQYGWNSLVSYVTSWGLLSPLEQSNPPIFIGVTVALVVLAIVGYSEERQRKAAEARAQAERDRLAREAHERSLAAQATASSAHSTATEAHEAATQAQTTAASAHETATSAHQAASEAKAHVADVEQRVHVLEQGKAAEPLPAGPPQDDALLPAPDPFIGRREALDWLEQRLTTHTAEGRVSAITALGGLGGIGKSALAGQALKELRMNKRFPDGVAVVLANDQRDARALLRAVLARFEPRIDAALPADASLGALATAAHHLLDGKDALVVLDNVEPDDASNGWEARLVLDALKATGVAVLVTARQEVSGVPAGGTRQLDVLPEDEARDLFAEYYAGKPWADLSDADQQAAERILTTLGRHTLALTLAATYIKTTQRPLAKVAEELANPHRALTIEVPGVPRSVSSTFDLSYRDLPGGAQRLFRALGAAGTNEIGRMATLALARALDVDEPEASVDLLVARALARPSTLTGLPEGADSERLTLHPLLREFAASLLGSGPERERAEDALAAFHAEYINLPLFDVTYEANPLIAVDEANITAALDTAHVHGDRDRVVSDLCWGMAQFWRDRGKTHEGLERVPWGIAAAVAVAKASGERDDRTQEARLIAIHGDFLRRTGRLADASASYEQSLAVLREVSDRQGEGVVLANLGQVARARGQLSEAQAYYEQALAIEREVGDRQGEGTVLSTLGSVALARGQLGEAQTHFEQSLAIRREVGDRQGEGVELNNLSAVAYQRGDWDSTERFVRDALSIAREVGDRPGEAQMLANLGQFLAERQRGAPGEGCAMLAEAARLYDEMGVPGGDDVRATMRRLGCAG